MARYIPAWQRVVLTALNNTHMTMGVPSGWAALAQEEQQAVRTFITEKNKGDAARAEILLAQTLTMARPRRALSLGVIILLWVLALIAAPLLTFAFGLKWLAPALAVCLLWELCTAKSSRMRQLWVRRKSGEEAATQTLNDMFYVALRSPLAAVDKVKLAVMTAALALFMVLWALPAPAPAASRVLADKVGEVTAGQATMTDALALLPEGADGLDTIRQAMKYTAHGSDEEFLLASLMWMHMEADGALMLSDYATGTAGPPMYEALENTDPSQIGNPEEIAALSVLLKYAGAHQEIALMRFLAEENLPEGVLSAFGSAMHNGRTDGELLLLCDEIQTAGHDPQPFLLAALPDMDYARAEEIVSSAGDEAQRGRLIRVAAPALTRPDDVLAFIRLAKEYGVSAAECYPNGALLTWDTTMYDPYYSAQASRLGKRDTFLIIRRTEKPEPFTSVPVEKEDQTAYDEALPEELYTNYDPDAHTGAAQFTVVLETAVLDSMPAECIPLSIAECDALVILDSWYQCDGYVRSSRSTSMYQASKKHQADIPTYGMMQLIAVYNVQSGEMLFAGKYNVALSPAMLRGEERMGMDEWALEENYIAPMDEEWMDEAYEAFLISLIRRNWQLVP